MQFILQIGWYARLKIGYVVTDGNYEYSVLYVVNASDGSDKRRIYGTENSSAEGYMYLSPLTGE